MYVSLFNLSGFDSEERRSVHSAETRENRTNMFWGICKGQKKKRKKSPSHSPSLCAAAAAARHGSSEQRCDFIFRITAASLNVTRRLWIRLSSSKTAHPAACCANPGRKVVQRMWAMGKNSDVITKLLITHSCPCCSTLAGILGARATSQSPIRHLWITACRQKLF